MKELAILLAVLAVALGPTAALARNDKTPPGQVVSDDGADSPGQTGQDDKPDPPGEAKQGDQHQPPGQARQDDKPDAPGHAKAPAGKFSTADELAQAQRAVQANGALPLARIISIAEALTTGHVINVRLTTISDLLLYQLTFLDDRGRSWREYFNARTGKPVVIP